MLEEDGLVLQGRHPLMVCTPSSFRPFQAPGVTVVPLRGDEPDATIVTFVQIQRESFDGLTEPPPAADVECIRKRMGAGPIRFALALLNGVPAGTGNTIPIAGVAELSGVATSPAFRRRGVAATISSFLTKQLLIRVAAWHGFRLPMQQPRPCISVLATQ